MTAWPSHFHIRVVLPPGSGYHGRVFLFSTNKLTSSCFSCLESLMKDSPVYVQVRFKLFWRELNHSWRSNNQYSKSPKIFWGYGYTPANLKPYFLYSPIAGNCALVVDKTIFESLHCSACLRTCSRSFLPTPIFLHFPDTDILCNSATPGFCFSSTRSPTIPTTLPFKSATHMWQPALHMYVLSMSAKSVLRQYLMNFQHS